MAKMLLKIPSDLDKEIGVYKINNDYKRKSDVIISILYRYFNSEKEKEIAYNEAGGDVEKQIS